MTINLAKTYVEAFEAGANYFSKSFLLEDIAPLTLLNQLDDEKKDSAMTRFFWQTPDEQAAYIGIGEAAFFTAREVSKLNVRELGYFYQGTPALLFGGFPFDEQGKRAPLWGELAEGGFILPKLFVKFTANSHKVEAIMTCPRPKKVAEIEAFFLEYEKEIRAWVGETQSARPIECPLGVRQEELEVPEWLETVNQAVATIQDNASPLEKIVLARQLIIEVEKGISLSDLMTRLATQQPNTYLFLIERAGHAFIGATPERLLSATNEVLMTAAVAGSIARGNSLEEDELLGKELLNSAKNTHEHQIVVDRISNEMAPFVTGNVQVSERQLLKNRDIQHLYATITGHRKSNLSFIEMIQQLHPTPALGGEPKVEAMSWIRTHEPIGRGMYGAPIGWLSLHDEGGEFAVGIRSAVITDKQALLYAGCGIVGDSVATEEREETKIKFEPMRRGILSDVASKGHD